MSEALKNIKFEEYSITQHQQNIQLLNTNKTSVPLKSKETST